MREIGNSFLIAFSMYSRIPVPEVSWSEENRRYVLAFFPLVGLVITLILWLWVRLAAALGAPAILRACVGVALPLLATGGIHMDGFLDVCDAVSSRRDRTERLRILKDPHIGAFAVIGAAVFFVLAVGFASSLPNRAIPVLFLVFPLSRAISAASVILNRSASPGGTAAVMEGDRRFNLTVSGVVIGFCAVLMFRTDARVAPFVLIAILLAVLYHLFLVRRVFGGITGDVAGHLVCTVELSALIGAVVGGWIAGGLA